METTIKIELMNKKQKGIKSMDIKDLETFVRLLESQRDLTYHLQKYREAVAERVKELEIITQKAQKVVQLKHLFKKGQKALWLTLTPEEVKQVNNMLQQRHIQI